MIIIYAVMCVDTYVVLVMRVLSWFTACICVRVLPTGKSIGTCQMQEGLCSFFGTILCLAVVIVN